MTTKTVQPITPEVAAKLLQLREPTPEMIMAGLGQLHKTREIGPADAVRAIFQAMVDRALSPKRAIY
jgi:hypothetical protein